MREGGVRQIIFPPELGYPMVGDQRNGKMADPSHDRVGPKPASFSGSRAPDFVLTSKSDNVDKTLLLNFKSVPSWRDKRPIGDKSPILSAAHGVK